MKHKLFRYLLLLCLCLSVLGYVTVANRELQSITSFRPHKTTSLQKRDDEAEEADSTEASTEEGAETETAESSESSEEPKEEATSTEATDSTETTEKPKRPYVGYGCRIIKDPSITSKLATVGIPVIIPRNLPNFIKTKRVQVFLKEKGYVIELMSGEGKKNIWGAFIAGHQGDYISVCLYYFTVLFCSTNMED